MAIDNNKYAIHDPNDIIKKVLAHPELGCAPKVLFMTLLFFADWKNGKAWPTQETLAFRTGTTRRTVNENIQKLIDANLLIRESKRGRKQGGNYLGSNYQINFNHIKQLKFRCDNNDTFNSIEDVSKTSHLTDLNVKESASKCEETRILNVKKSALKCEDNFTQNAFNSFSNNNFKSFSEISLNEKEEKTQQTTQTSPPKPIQLTRELPEDWLQAFYEFCSSNDISEGSSRK